MNILRTYVEGDIKNNKKKYNATRITIFLAVVILSTFLFAVQSYFMSNINKIAEDTGGYHFKINNPISNNDAKNLALNRHIEKIGFIESEEIEESFGSKDKIKLLRLNDSALSTVQSSLKKGSLPEVGEVMISDRIANEINKDVTEMIEIKNNRYKISGIYYETLREDQDFYKIYLNTNQEDLLKSDAKLLPIIWFNNVFRTNSLSKEIIKDLAVEDDDYNYNSNYLAGFFVVNQEIKSLSVYSNHILIISLFVLLIILFYLIIVNLFMVQETKAINEYSKLKAIGATNKDISKIIRLKSIYLSQLPIALGILSSFALVKVLFSIINKIEEYFTEGRNIYLSLDLTIDFKLVLFVYLLSFLVVYLSTRKPIKEVNKNSILKGLNTDIKGKTYKKHDLTYKGNIEKDLSRQFYQNSKTHLRFTGVTLKIGFLLMISIMMAFTYYSMNGVYNQEKKYETYDVQAEYFTPDSLDETLLKNIETLEIDELVTFRKEMVYSNLNESMLNDRYKNSNSLESFKENVASLDSVPVEIIGIENEIFKEFALNQEINPKKYTNEDLSNQAILLNTLGNRFDIPVTKIESKTFLNENINKLKFSEYDSFMDSSDSETYKFTLNVEDKINSPLFGYPVKKSFLTLYIPRSEYISLLDKFKTPGDIDQIEYLSIKTNHPEEVKEKMNEISLDYFKEDDFEIETKLDEDTAIQKGSVIGSVLSIFLSLFFIVVGFSNSYFSFYNLFLKRKEEFLVYQAVGMDKKLLNNVLKRERRRIIIKFLFSMPFIILIVAYLMSKLFEIFSPIDFLLNLNTLFVLVILGYVLLIYLSTVIIYRKHSKELTQKN